MMTPAVPAPALPGAGAPAPATTAGPVDLTREQIAVLLAPLNENRVQYKQGQAHVEAWDVRRWLNRAFGFGGWADQTLELVCLSEREINPGRWTVVYRAQVRLIVKTTDGRVLSFWDDAAMGDAINQKALGAAHDQAMKTALSQALKRCAVNLGDSFGLSLYNGGRAGATVMWSAAHLAPKNLDADKGSKAKAEQPAVDPVRLAAADEPVQPEPEAPAEPEQHPADAEQAQQHPVGDDGGQVRYSDRAEPGPWETPPAGQPAQQPAAGQAPPPEQRIAEDAAHTRDVEEVRRLYREAKAADLLTATVQTPLGTMELGAYLGARGGQLGGQGQQQRPTQPRQGHTNASGTPTATGRATEPPRPEQSAPTDNGWVTEADRQHAAALQAMYAAARDAGLTPAEAADAFQARYSCMPEQANADQLGDQTSALRAAMNGTNA